jgi:uncharacterized BrkB/YihY/UPF0761 family membrane protein
MTANGPVADNRLERVLAYMILGVFTLSIAAFVAVIFATASGMQAADFSAGLWPAVTLLPWFGLPLAMLLMIVLFVVVIRRRGRAAKDAVK